MKMNIKIKYLTIILLFLGTMRLYSSKVQARITTSDPTVKSGQNVTIIINSQEDVASGAIKLNSSEELEFISATGGEENGGVVAFAGAENKKSGIATYTFKAPNVSETTTYKVTFSSQDMADSEGNNVESSSATATITVEGTGENTADTKQETPNENTSITEVQPQTPSNNDTTPVETLNNTENVSKSSNNYLKSLTIGTGTLQPAFYRETLNYTVKFNDDFDYKSFTSLNIKALAEDTKAKITGTGNIAINEGENNIAIRVTAENGSVRTYNIKVEKPVPLKQSDMRLKTLELNKITKDNKIEKVELDKEFNPETFEYSLDVDADTMGLDVNAIVDKQGIIVTVEGDKNLTEGENEVIIKLTTQDDDSIQTTYKIKVNKAKSEEKEEKEEKNVENKKTTTANKTKRIITGFIALIGMLLVTLIILLIINKTMKKNGKARIDYENNDYMEYDEENSLYGGKAELEDDDDVDGDDDEIEEKPKKRRIRRKEPDLEDNTTKRKSKGKHF